MVNRKTAKKIKSLLGKKSVILTGCAAVAVVIVLLWPAVLNRSFYSINKDQANSQLSKLITKLQPPSAQLLYANVSDEGCKSNGVGLAGYTSCSLLAEKYFKSVGNPEQPIRQLDLQLKQNGYTSSLYSNDYNVEKTLSVPKGLQEGSAPYKSSEKEEYLTLYVEFFDKGNIPVENYLIQELIKSNKLPKPSLHDSYFGLRLEKTYWKCNSTSLFELYCPAPPSEPK